MFYYNYDGRGAVLVLNNRVEGGVANGGSAAYLAEAFRRSEKLEGKAYVRELEPVSVRVSRTTARRASVGRP